jgi:hypothetical protein
MKRLLIIASLGAALALPAPAAAHQAGPCNTSEEPGHSEFAKHHVVPFAQEGELGAGGHKPGSHRGMSACEPSENRP